MANGGKLDISLKEKQENIQKTGRSEKEDDEMKVKIGHILKKEKENIQKTWHSEKEDMKWK